MAVADTLPGVIGAGANDVMAKDSSSPGSPPSHPLPLHVSSPEELPAASTPKEYLVDVANMLKAFIGLNVMYTSYAFSKAGLVRGIIGLLIVTYLTEHCCLLLIDVKNGLPASALHRRRINAAAAADAAAGGSTTTVGAASMDDPHGGGGGYTYADIAGAVLGPAGDAFVSASLVLTQFGYCVGYLIFMSQTVHDLVASAGSPVWAYVLVPLPLLAGLSLLRSIRSLGPFSMLANLALMAGVVAVVVYIGDHFRWAPSHPPLASLPLFFGQMTAAIEGIGLVVPVESSMRRPSEFAGVLRSALAVLTVVLAVVGVLGFVTFGEDTRSIILLNMKGSALVSIVKIVLVVGILFTYPLQLVPVIQALETWMESDSPFEPLSPNSASTSPAQSPRQASPTTEELEEEGLGGPRGLNGQPGGEYAAPTGGAPLPVSASSLATLGGADSGGSPGVFVSDARRVLGRFLIVAGTAVVAMLAGASFGLFQSLVGSLGAATLAYTVPSLLHLKLYGNTLPLHVRIKDYAILAFGVVGAVLGTAVTVWEIARIHSGAAVPQ
eukprot:TRINITY_DN2083_c0_g1_i10.p1 TRINITY_DN2083_c0_g1~~TRINITY_DN2083_c0_g1_i10.p1  ORF type:complete len:552 (-),score=138.55 TRINITY_DN2083_c0_g1_i10:229-1884(-)